MLNKNILALDQASQVTGWAVFKNGKLAAYGKIAPDGELIDRLIVLRAAVKTIIEEHEINFVALEDIQLQTSVGNNVQTFKALAFVLGVLQMTVKEMGIDYEVVASSSWKSTLSIKGRNRAEQKRNAQEYVLNTYNLKVIQDTCDAICIGAHILSKNKSPKVEDFNWD